MSMKTFCRLLIVAAGSADDVAKPMPGYQDPNDTIKAWNQRYGESPDVRSYR